MTCDITTHLSTNPVKWEKPNHHLNNINPKK